MTSTLAITGRGRGHARRGAFTLLEILLAIGMIAMLSLSLFAALNVGFRARETAAAAVIPPRAAAIAMELIQEDLQSVLPPAKAATGRELAGPFLGTHQMGLGAPADYVQFYCVGADRPDDDSPFAEGIRMTELSLRTDVDPPVLVRRVTRNLLAAVQEEPAEEVLCRQVTSFTLEYCDGTTWQDGWDSTALEDALPTAVRVTIEMRVPPRRGDRGEQPKYRISRVIPLTCAKPLDASLTGGILP